MAWKIPWKDLNPHQRAFRLKVVKMRMRKRKAQLKKDAETIRRLYV